MRRRSSARRLRLARLTGGAADKRRWPWPLSQELEEGFKKCLAGSGY